MLETQTEILFTARNIYDLDSDESSWLNYVKWSRLTHVKEIVSLDGVLNDLVFQPNYEKEIDEIAFNKHLFLPFFKRIEYVKEKASSLEYYNLLAVIKEPSQEKQVKLEKDFDFIGYDLIEKEGDISALTNCGGFDETFDTQEQNEYGLISDYERAKEIQRELRKNNPQELHADCFLYEIWRHKFVGRNGSFDENFCLALEYHLGSTLEKSHEERFKGFWCDGVVSKRVSKKVVNDNRTIETKAWIGKDGQTEFDMKIKLGKYSLKRFAKGTSMVDCLPSSDFMNWVKIDLENKKIEIELK
jgi:hypothetical protein